jgi:hypothetical protein
MTAMTRTLEMEIGNPLRDRLVKNKDPAKLLILIEKLCYALDGERRNSEGSPVDTDIQGNELSSFLGD